MSNQKPVDAARIAATLERLRRERPLVQNITNYVSMDIAANALLALGASPAMVHAVEEIEEFGALSGALAINIGTLSSDWIVGMDAAAAAAARRGTPWVLDPVGAGATRFRNETVVRLAAHRPAVVRGNASEIIAVAAALGLAAPGSRPKGVDSADTTDSAEGIAAALASHLHCVVVATGAVDIVTDGQILRRLANGSPLMAQVTAVGCSLSAITAAFCAVEPDRLEAATAAVAVASIAGELAAEIARLPGSFRTAWIDGLASINGTLIAERLRLG